MYGRFHPDYRPHQTVDFNRLLTLNGKLIKCKICTIYKCKCLQNSAKEDDDDNLKHETHFMWEVQTNLKWSWQKIIIKPAGTIPPSWVEIRRWDDVEAQSRYQENSPLNLPEYKHNHACYSWNPSWWMSWAFWVLSDADIVYIMISCILIKAFIYWETLCFSQPT